METRKHIAAENNRQKTHNCAQAVACTYCDLCGLDSKVVEDIAGSFGLGMGNMEGTCGSLVGAASSGHHSSRFLGDFACLSPSNIPTKGIEPNRSVSTRIKISISRVCE